MQELDCRGLKCPMPLVRVSGRLKEMEVGEALKVTADDLAFCPDIKAWTELTGHSLIECVERDKECYVVIQKNAEG